ncbi:MAG: hypothetical protein ACKVWR_09575 [Acidimicrobiales bacterium]
MLRAGLVVVGALVVAGAWASALHTLVVPRAGRSVFVSRLSRLMLGAFRLVAGRLHTYEAKDRVLSRYGPVFLLTMLVAWLAVLLGGFGLLVAGAGGLGAEAAFRRAGSSMFTLGFAGSEHVGLNVLDFAAALTSPALIGLLVGYLPTLYGAFNRREMLVTMLDSRAGVPAWGPEILARAALADTLDRLGHFYEDWERWAADVAESHSSYRALLFFRSPEPWRSWVTALLAVLDAAALHQALCPTAAPVESRSCLRMGFLCFQDLAQAVGMPVNRDPLPSDPVELEFGQFLAAVERLEAAGLKLERSPDEAWRHFCGWRVNYEAAAYALAERVMAPPAPWSGARRGLRGAVAGPQRPAHRSPDDPAGEHARVKPVHDPG